MKTTTLAVAKESREYWAKFWAEGARVNVPDLVIQRIYDYGIYRFGAMTDPDGAYDFMKSAMNVYYMMMEVKDGRLSIPLAPRALAAASCRQGGPSLLEGTSLEFHPFPAPEFPNHTLTHPSCASRRVPRRLRRGSPGARRARRRRRRTSGSIRPSKAPRKGSSFRRKG